MAMAAPKTRSGTVKSPANTPQLSNVNGNDDRTPTTDAQKISLYEQSREQRIRENRERMEKLGIMDLSLKVKSHISHRPIRFSSSHCKTPRSHRPSTVHPSGPIRRSSRLQNVTPVSYSEVLPKKHESLQNGNSVTADSKPEIYTEEHEKLLGNTEKSWTLFVDGYGKDGKRIYDSIRGKTCHQCRQKTLGYRTQCSQCNMVQGQFCGDCLYMRYGEHVLEALQNPHWICPVCRGICNCSLCRQAKGWAPTGYLYRKVSALGYKSVAHYLIQTRRSDANVEKDADASNPVPEKRSLPFPDTEVLSYESVEVNDNHHVGSLKPLSEGDRGQVSAKRSLPFSHVQDQHDEDGCLDNMKPPSEGDRGQVSAKRSLPFSHVQDQHDKDGCLDNMKPPSESDRDQVSAKRSLPFSDVQDQHEKVERLFTKKPFVSSTEPREDSIARRLRPRHKKA